MPPAAKRKEYRPDLFEILRRHWELAWPEGRV